MDKCLKSYLDNQPILNLGCLGVVSEGKSTLIQKLTGIKTQRHSSEVDRNITIKQGYGNMKIWKNIKNDNLYSTNSNVNNTEDILLHHISFVDCPGHQDLLLTLLNSISLMDGVIFVIAVNQPLYKKHQLIQQLIATKIKKITKYIFCLNKIDLVPKSTTLIRKQELDNILKFCEIEPNAIIPTCFNKKIGLDILLESIINIFDLNSCNKKNNDSPVIKISRSFDINKPGTPINDLKGGIIGGCLVRGNISIKDKICILPGYCDTSNNEQKFIPIKTEIISIKTDEINLNNVCAGGLIGIGTDIDPYFTKGDLLKGQIGVSELNHNYNIVDTITIVFHNMEFLSCMNSIDKSVLSMINIVQSWKAEINTNIIVQSDNTATMGLIKEINLDKLTIKLNKLICIEKDQIFILLIKNNSHEIVGIGYYEN